MVDGEGMKRGSQVYPNLFYALESPRVKLMEIDSAYDSLEKQKPKMSKGDSPGIWSLRSCIRTGNIHETQSLQSLLVNQSKYTSDKSF